MSDRKPNSILSDIWSHMINNPFITTHHPENALRQIENLEKVVWQAKETLRALVVKQKTWEAKEASQEVQLEQEHSIPNNDQRLHEKEQSPRTTKQSDISLQPMDEIPLCSLVQVVYYHDNTITTTTIYCLCFPEPFESLARQLLIDIGEGKTVCIPSTMELEIVRL